MTQNKLKQNKKGMTFVDLCCNIVCYERLTTSSLSSHTYDMLAATKRGENSGMIRAEAAVGRA